MLADLILLVSAAPDDEDVVAGPIGAVIFVGLILGVVVIGFALTRSLKTAERAKDAGVYGPVETDDAATTDDGPDSSSGSSTRTSGDGG